VLFIFYKSANFKGYPIVCGNDAVCVCVTEDVTENVNEDATEDVTEGV